MVELVEFVLQLFVNSFVFLGGRLESSHAYEHSSRQEQCSGVELTEQRSEEHAAETTKDIIIWVGV